MRRDRAGAIEGGVLLAAGLVALADGMRMVVYKSRLSVEDFTGPGRYLLAIGLFMAAIGAVHLAASCLQRPAGDVDVLAAPDDIAWRRLLLTVAALMAYLLLLDAVGYFLSTIVFFLVILRVMGEPFGLRLALIGVALAAALYLIFVQLFGMTFPRGAIFT